MASPSRSRRVASNAKAASSGRKPRPPSPKKAKAGNPRRGSSGKRKAIPKAKQNGKASPRSNGSRRAKDSSKTKKPRGESRKATLADRKALFGRHQTSDYLTDVLDELRQDVAGLRSDVEDLRRKCHDANSEAALATLFDREARRVRRWLLRELGAGKRDQQRGGEEATDVSALGAQGSPQEPRSIETEAVLEAPDGNKQHDQTRLFGYARADYELLKQQTEHVDSADKKCRRISLKSLETLLVEMLKAEAHAPAGKPTAFMVEDSDLDKRTARCARKRLYVGEYIDAQITTRTKTLNRMHGGEKQGQEYWSAVRLTDRGVALARYICSLNQPHLKHLMTGGDSVEAIDSSSGSTDELNEDP
jgi:hypothetical protein